MSPTYSHTSHQSTNSPKTTQSVPTQTYLKQGIQEHQTHNFRRINPFGIAPVKKKKKHIRLGHADIIDHSVDSLIPDF